MPRSRSTGICVQVGGATGARTVAPPPPLRLFLQEPPRESGRCGEHQTYHLPCGVGGGPRAAPSPCPHPPGVHRPGQVEGPGLPTASWAPWMALTTAWLWLLARGRGHVEGGGEGGGALWGGSCVGGVQIFFVPRAPINLHPPLLRACTRYHIFWHNLCRSGV